MKKLMLIILGIALVGGGVYWLGMANDFLEKNYGTTTIYNAPTEPEVRIEKFEELDVRIEDAIETALPAIETEAKNQYEKAVAEAKAAHDKYIADEKVKVTDKVKEDYIAEIEATITTPTY